MLQLEILAIGMTGSEEGKYEIKATLFRLRMYRPCPPSMIPVRTGIVHTVHVQVQ